MSEMPPDPQAQGGNFLTRRYAGIPAVVWVAGAALAAYFLFFRGGGSSGGSGGATSTGGGGTSTTGDIQLQPGTETIDLTGTTSGTGVGNTAPVQTGDNDTGQPEQSGTPNSQPTPTPPPRHKTGGHKVTKPATPGTAEVTVAKWPGKSGGGLSQWNTTLWGIANHYHTTVAELLKLNPGIKNANLVFPGQKVKVPT